MKRSRLLYCLLLALPLLSPAQGGNTTNRGSVAAPFLSISLDPRGTAMGSAGTALGGGIQSVLWNPAALAEKGHSAFLAHADWLAGINIEQAGVSFSLGNFGNIGAYLTALNYGEMKVRTVPRPEGTGEKFDASDFSLALYYARDLTDRFTLGAGIKYIRQQIWHTSASSVAFDIGTLFKSPIWDIDFGVNISNFGGDLQLAGRDTRVYHDVDPVRTGNNDRIPAQLELDPWPLPLLMRAGVQRRFSAGVDHNFVAAVDIYYPQDNSESLNVGLEYGFRKMFFMRAGYRGIMLKDNQGGLSAGLAYAFRDAQTVWALDVAYTDYGLLDNVTIVALSIKWF